MTADIVYRSISAIDRRLPIDRLALCKIVQEYSHISETRLRLTPYLSDVQRCRNDAHDEQSFPYASLPDQHMNGYEQKER